MRSLLERYLDATRPGHRSILVELEDDLIDEIRFTLPDLAPLPVLHVIHSRQRRWEYLSGAGLDPAGLLVVDQALEDALLDLEHLMMVRHDGGPALAWLLAADAFRHQRADRPYLLLSATAHDFVDKIASLAALRARRADRTTRKFLLLHEFGHVALARKLPWTDVVRRAVVAMRDSFLSHVRERLADPGRTPSGYVHGFGVPLEETSIEMLLANFGRYVEIGGTDEELVEELCCDWIAALGLAGLSGPWFADVSDHPLPGSWRRAADGLFLAARLVRLLAFVVGMRHLARSAVPNGPAYAVDRYQTGLIIRFNILTNLASSFNAKVLSHVDFVEGHGFPTDAHAESIVAAFKAGQVRDGRLFHERIFKLYETIEPVRMPHLVAADLAHAFPDGEPSDPRMTADRLRIEIDRRIEIALRHG